MYSAISEHTFSIVVKSNGHLPAQHLIVPNTFSIIPNRSLENVKFG